MGIEEKLPSDGEIDQVGLIDTAFPHPSVPEALKVACDPTRIRALAGVTVIVESAAAVTV